MVLIILIAIVTALAFGIGWITMRGHIVLAACVLWAAYVPYEIWVQKTCTGECNIRVDLVLIYPVLLVVALLALGSVVWRLVRKKGGAE